MNNRYTKLGIIITVVIALSLASTPTLIQKHQLLVQSAYAYVYNVPDAPVAASGSHVYVTWATNKTGNWEIMFRASNDNGKTFDDKINLSNSPNANSFHSDISASGDNNVYVSFHDAKTGNVVTYVRTSTDAGKTFGPIVTINGTGTQPQKPHFIIRPIESNLQESEENTRIAASADGHVYVVSWDKKTGNWEVFLARSTDNGKTFEKTINLSNSSDTRSDRAWLVAEGSNVYVSWWETAKGGMQQPVIRVSNDNGATFGPILKLSSNGPIGNSSGVAG
jgi:BNR repeat-like domain